MSLRGWDSELSWELAPMLSATTIISSRARNKPIRKEKRGCEPCGPQTWDEAVFPLDILSFINQGANFFRHVSKTTIYLLQPFGSPGTRAAFKAISGQTAVPTGSFAEQLQVMLGLIHGALVDGQVLRD